MPPPPKGGHVPPPPPQKKSGKIFLGQLLCKIRAFLGKNHVKFGHFVIFFNRATLYALRGLCGRNSVCLSVSPSVCHTRAL